MNKVKTVFLISVFSILILTLSVLITFRVTRMYTLKEVGLVSNDYFSVEVFTGYIPDFKNKYSSFLDDEKAEFICKLCQDFNVDPDFAIGLLQRENPSLITNAVSDMNANGTVDTGLWQLNDLSLYRDGGFITLWWKPEFGEFNSSNWKHNTYIAIKLIQDLQKTFGDNNLFYIACAYNAGVPRTYDEYINGVKRIPYSTRTDYAPAVVLNYQNWKKIS